MILFGRVWIPVVVNEAHNALCFYFIRTPSGALRPNWRHLRPFKKISGYAFNRDPQVCVDTDFVIGNGCEDPGTHNVSTLSNTPDPGMQLPMPSVARSLLVLFLNKV